MRGGAPGDALGSKALQEATGCESNVLSVEKDGKGGLPGLDIVNEGETTTPTYMIW